MTLPARDLAETFGRGDDGRRLGLLFRGLGGLLAAPVRGLGGLAGLGETDFLAPPVLLSALGDDIFYCACEDVQT